MLHNAKKETQTTIDTNMFLKNKLTRACNDYECSSQLHDTVHRQSKEQRQECQQK